MQKFTVFTIILTATVVVVVADMMMNEYSVEPPKDPNNLSYDLPENLDLSKVMETNVLNAGNNNELSNKLGADNEFASDDPLLNSETIRETSDVNSFPFGGGFQDSGSDSDLPDFEDPGADLNKFNSVILREDQIKSAGFSDSYIEPENDDGFLFKTIYTADLQGVKTQKAVIRNSNTLFAKAYLITVSGNSGISSVYDVLKIRSSEGLDSEINEVNAYGNGSFFMNDTRRQHTAFLVVKFPEIIYAFSYPKEYHQQIVNLLTLIQQEIK